MNKKNAPMITLALTAAVLAGCSSTGSRKPASAGDDLGYVDAKLLETAASIDHSLETLTVLTRGDEGRRRDGHIGSTVAGKAEANAKPQEASTAPLPGTPAHEALKAEHRQLLQKRVNLAWRGKTQDLIKQLTDAAGYTLLPAQGTPKSLPEVLIDRKNITLEEAFRATADQVTAVASIEIKTAEKTVRVIYR